MVREKTHTLHPHHHSSKLINFEGFRSIKLRNTASSCVESVGSNDVPIYFHPNRQTQMPRGVPKNPQQRCENVRWSIRNETIFIELMHEQYLEGQLLTTAFSPQVMKIICTKLNALVDDGSVYTEEKCKTKYQRIKRSWKLLNRLKTYGGSGLEWDYDRNTVIGPPEVLDPIYKEHPDNKGIIDHGLPHFELCTEMFIRIVATGSHARSSMQPPIDSDDETPGAYEPYFSMGSPSINNFTPGSSSHDMGTSSRSSGKKRSSNASDKDAILIQTMENFNAFIVEKRSRTGQFSKDELNLCIAEVRAMDGLPQSLFIKAANMFKSYANRAVFLSLNSSERRMWVEALAD